MGIRMKTLGVVDNDGFALCALKAYLDQTLDGITLAWMTEHANTAIARCMTGERPDVLLVDMSMGDIDGVSVIRTIRERDRRTSLVAMTSFPLDEYAADAATAGAQAIVSKNDLQGLQDTIRLAATGGTGSFEGLRFPTAAQAFARILREPKTGIARLSGREIEIIELCRQGDTSTLIAERTGLTVASVNTYLQRACEKLGGQEPCPAGVDVARTEQAEALTMTGRDMDGGMDVPGRRFMLTACCCAMLADLYFTAVGGNLADGRSWIPLIPYVLLCGALPFRPKTAGLLLIVYWWILVWLPTGSASDLLFSSCLVWGVLSFLLSPWMTLLAQSCNVLLLSLTVLRDTSEPRAVIAVLVMQIAATVAGYALRRHRLDDTAREQRLRLRTTQERIAILERNMRLARRLHDDLTNNLASIGMLCEAHLLSCSDPDERLLLTSIRDKTRESVSCAHEVIDILRGQTGPDPASRTRPGGWGQTIRGLVEARQAELRRHGFEGSASVTIDPDAVLPMAVVDEIVSLLAEVYSNIRAHASPTDGGFSLELAVSDDGIRLVQMNMCRPDDRTVSGRGLQLHRHIIATLGGTLTTSLEDDVWTLKAHIPKHSPQA